MPTLTVVMIMRNEAEWLPPCLKSVLSIADAIVIGDTGSTDSSVALAKQFGAYVIEVQWTNDFAAARNAVLEAATGDWLLHMDADEMLDAQSAAAIRSIVDDDGRGADAIELTLANYSDDVRAWRWVAAPPNDPNARGRTGYIAVPLPRLFRNHRGFHYREPIHENITESVVKNGGVIGQAHDILIHHHGFGKGGPEKAARYLDIARAKVLQRPNDTKAWHDLAEQLVSMDRSEEALAAAQRSLSCDPNNVAAATTLANILLNKGEIEDARQLLEPFAANPAPPAHVLVALSAIATRQGRDEDAKSLADRAIEIAPNNILARLTAARACDLAGAHDNAVAHLDTAHAIAPEVKEISARRDALSLRRQAESLSPENANEILSLLVSALKLDPEDPLIHVRLSQVLQGLGDSIRAAQARHRAKTLAPGSI